MRGSVERTASLTVAKTRCRGGQTRWPWRAEWPLQGISSEKAASGGCGPISTNHVALFGLSCTRFYPAPCFGHIPTRYTLFWPPPFAICMPTEHKTCSAGDHTGFDDFDNTGMVYTYQVCAAVDHGQSTPVVRTSSLSVMLPIRVAVHIRALISCCAVALAQHLGRNCHFPRHSPKAM